MTLLEYPFKILYTFALYLRRCSVVAEHVTFSLLRPGFDSRLRYLEKVSGK